MTEETISQRELDEDKTERSERFVKPYDDRVRCPQCQRLVDPCDTVPCTIGEFTGRPHDVCDKNCCRTNDYLGIKGLVVCQDCEVNDGEKIEKFLATELVKANQILAAKDMKIEKLKLDMSICEIIIRDLQMQLAAKDLQ